MILNFGWLSLDIKTQYENIQDPTKETINELIKNNIENKMSSYIKKIKENTKSDKIFFVINLSLNKKNKYDWIFDMSYPGIKNNVRYQREDYEKLDDLVNHAFDNISQRIPDLCESGIFAKIRKFFRKK